MPEPLLGGCPKPCQHRVNPKTFQLGFVRSFDGLRGIAILMVMSYHAELAGDYFGFIGVDLFFALSGFLITSLLVEEWTGNNSISLKRFYARRALRLLPAVVIFLTTLFIYACFFGSKKTSVANYSKEAFMALFYFTNWARALGLFDPHLLGHTWSLSVEEQFYLLWPFLLVFRLRRSDRKSIVSWIFLGAFAAAFLRFILPAGSVVTFERLYNGLDTRADTLLLGCAAAICISSNLLPQSKRFRIVLRCAALVSAAALCLMALTMQAFTQFAVQFGWSAVSIFCFIILVELATRKEGTLQWLLQTRALVFTGKISYGLYLWHWPVLLILRGHHIEHWRLVSIPIILILTLASYHLVEQPCLKLKRRFDFRTGCSKGQDLSGKELSDKFPAPTNSIP